MSNKCAICRAGSGLQAEPGRDAPSDAHSLRGAKLLGFYERLSPSSPSPAWEHLPQRGWGGYGGFTGTKLPRGSKVSEERGARRARALGEQQDQTQVTAPGRGVERGCAGLCPKRDLHQNRAGTHGGALTQPLGSWLSSFSSFSNCVPRAQRGHGAGRAAAGTKCGWAESVCTQEAF